MECSVAYLDHLRAPVIPLAPPRGTAPPWDEPHITAEELAGRIAIETLSPAEKLAILEAVAPMPRPPKRACWLDRVDYIEGVDRQPRS
jgi:hypothetical protein